MSFNPTSAALDYDDDPDSVFDLAVDPLQGFPSTGAFVDSQHGLDSATPDVDEEEDDEEEEEDEMSGQIDLDGQGDLPTFCKRYEKKKKICEKRSVLKIQGYSVV